MVSPIILSLSDAMQGMYTPGTYINVQGQLLQIVTSQVSKSGTTLTTVPVRPDLRPSRIKTIALKDGQGTSKACIDCRMSLVCGYLNEPIPFYFCPVCQRIYIPLVIDPTTSPVKIKQILIKKECPVKKVLDLKQPCQRCANQEKLNKRKRDQIYKATKGKKGV